MSRIIMLIPLEKNVSLTAISLSMMYFFNYKSSYKPILYMSCIKNVLDNTSLIINKYFSKTVHILKNIDFSTICFNSSEYFSLLHSIIETCYKKKFLYKLILIQGLNHHDSINFQKINYDVSQNLSAEVIFVSNLKCNSSQYIEKKEKNINIFLNYKKYKNVLGVIFNHVNSPFVNKRYNFSKKLIILNKIVNNKKNTSVTKVLFKNNFFKIIACIPWNQEFIKARTVDIYNFLKIENINIVHKENDFIKDIIMFDESSFDMLKKNYSNTLIIIAFSRIKNFLDIFNLLLQKKKISCIILTGVLTSKMYVINLCRVLIKKNIAVFFTENNTIAVLSKLQKFNFNIMLKEKLYIKKLQKYISSFFCYSSIMCTEKKCNYTIGYSPEEFSCYLKMKSRKKNKRIILPESYEIRILKAVAICSTDKIAQCVLLGEPKKIYNIANDNGIMLSKNIEIINPSLIRNKYVSRFIELRKHKGLDEYSAKKQLLDNVVLATLMLEACEVDGLVSGSINTTSNTIRPALQIIKTKSCDALVSSIFFMLLPDQVLIYGDCAININPTAEELAEIAIQSAESLKIFEIEPRIAMLSYSTGYSGFGSQVDKVRKATYIVNNKRPDLIIDGPIQYDAAISKTVSQLKAPYSPIVGSANVFIFPDLNSGNIAYKAVQRSTNIVSIGPMLQGLRKPVNDLSRGSSVEDIIYTIALTSLQSI